MQEQTGAAPPDHATANPYAPPDARIAEVAANGEAAIAPPFYVVSSRKFLLLFFGTVGIYSVYWFWRHWKLHKIDKTLDIWPVPRAIFQIFFAHSLNREVDHLIQRKRLRFDWSPGGLATLFVVASLVSGVADRLSWNGIGSPISDLVSLATLLPVGYCLLRTQQAANVACEDPAGDTNHRLTVANYAWLAVGALWWLLVAVGLMLPEEYAQ